MPNTSLFSEGTFLLGAGGDGAGLTFPTSERECLTLTSDDGVSIMILDREIILHPISSELQAPYTDLITSGEPLNE